MKKRFVPYTHDLSRRAAEACFQRKWGRMDILVFIEEYAGIDRAEIYNDLLTGNFEARGEALEAAACLLDNMVEDILAGRLPEEIEPVRVKERPDGMTGKVRKIASLSIPHQLLEHAVKLGLGPLLQSRLKPTQHASIPGRGQTGLKRSLGCALRSGRLGVRHAVKTDISNAYGAAMYADVIRLLEREVPAAGWILAAMRVLERLAPGGHLIIGGYLDAWIFNLMMAYAIEAMGREGSTRRGVFRPFVARIDAYMDDFALLCRTKTGAVKGMRALAAWLREHYGMAIRQTSSILRLRTVAEERRARAEPRRSRRGCPAVDMGGFLVHRSYVTMRPRVVKRVIRAFSRAWRELKETGTIRLCRVRSLSSRYGSVMQTSSRYFMRKYHVKEVIETARRVCAFWDRAAARARKEKMRWYIAEYSRRAALLA